MARRSLRRPILKSPPDDPQQEEVYRWENQNFGSLLFQHGMLPGEQRRLTAEICRYYKVPVPKVLTRYLGRKANMAEQNENVLHINGSKAKWTAMALAHEISHYIFDEYERLGPDHGPTWLGIYLHIMGTFHIMPADALAYSAKRAGLQFRDPAKCGPEDLC